MAGYRVGVVGCGMMGRQHVEALRRIPNVQVVAVADEIFAQDIPPSEFFQGIECFDNYRTMLEHAQLDVLHNCTPNQYHYEVNRYAFEQGVHVYCEKPFTITIEQAEELLALAHEKGLANGVNYNYRHNAMVQEMRQRISSGDAGGIFFVHGCYLQDWLMYDTDYSWRLDSEIGGETRALADIGSHWFDLAQFATGSKIQAVYAQLITAMPTRRKPLGPVESFVQSEGGGIYPLLCDKR